MKIKKFISILSVTALLSGATANVFTPNQSVNATTTKKSFNSQSSKNLNSIYNNFINAKYSKTVKLDKKSHMQLNHHHNKSYDNMNNWIVKNIIKANAKEKLNSAYVTNLKINGNKASYIVTFVLLGKNYSHEIEFAGKATLTSSKSNKNQKFEKISINKGVIKDTKVKEPLVGQK
ncbi:hypothetical protein MOO44_01735 [Nicoliella spurrieriana]|uniref:Uncharacterized protein n=1 Tax=Nicoliella spurrieriana TaxID=2925830 RepID=A0A976X5G4_9LACO|nr:hypothetical protein [Nicoliella spurrieriana]UQS86923.1 hypothetical protein MOO44_01735 [Nicoliella spurrieriana]